MENKKPHVVAIPYVGQGHLIPFLDLSKLLASQGMIVSYTTTPGNVARLQPQVDKFITSNPRADIRLVPIPMPPIDGVPPGMEYSDNAPLHITGILMTSSHKMAGSFEEWLENQMISKGNDSGSPPVCIISDMFTGWVHQSGAKFGIRTVVFQTSAAFSMSVMQSFLTHSPQKKAQRDDEYFDVPELSFDFKLRKSDLPIMLQDPDSNPVHNFITNEINHSMKCDGLIFNTFYELEPQGIEHIKTLTGVPVWSIGPMLPATVFETTGIQRAGSEITRGKASDISEHQCVEWLDARTPHSVVFVCFGSQISLNQDQIRVLSGGLEASGQAFIWVVRRETGAADVCLPECFEERTRDRGLVIRGWAPQLVILSHPSVGAFLSHCGWNSTLESVSLGVPMITWPMFAEQPFNSMLLVNHLRIAVQICVDIARIPEEEEIRKEVKMLLSEEEGKAMRMRAQEVRNKAKMAVAEGGSSHAHLEGFVKYIGELHETWSVTLHRREREQGSSKEILYSTVKESSRK